MIRYACDYVACFEDLEEAKSFKEAMEERLKQFSLEVAPEKTKLFEFGKFAQSKAKSSGITVVLGSESLILFCSDDLGIGQFTIDC